MVGVVCGYSDLPTAGVVVESDLLEASLTCMQVLKMILAKCHVHMSECNV